jgi:hypothetical protein
MQDTCSVHSALHASCQADCLLHKLIICLLTVSLQVLLFLELHRIIITIVPCNKFEKSDEKEPHREKSGSYFHSYY